MGTAATTIFDVEAEVDKIIGIEGKYSNNPADSGGEPHWGITAAVARAFGHSGSMKQMPRQLAHTIYRARYYTAPQFDKVASLSPAIARELKVIELVLVAWDEPIRAYWKMRDG